MSLRIATNTVDAVLDQYQRDWSPMYARGAVRVIGCAGASDRLCRGANGRVFIQ